MVYLTSMSRHQPTTTKSQKQEIRLFKLAQVLKKNRRRVRAEARECLLVWRKAANEQHLLLRKEILKLEMIKKHYMDEF
jgi:predicted DNA-binding transcriptional regulator